MDSFPEITVVVLDIVFVEIGKERHAFVIKCRRVFIIVVYVFFPLGGMRNGVQHFRQVLHVLVIPADAAVGNKPLLS